MNLDKNTMELISDLELIIGSQWIGPNTIKGGKGNKDRRFRFPVSYRINKKDKDFIKEKAKYIRFYQNDINATGTYEIEPLKGIIKSRELVSKKQLDDLLTESGSNDGKERFADFYCALKVEVVNCTEPKISCNNSDLNGVNGNDTFIPHSPKVVYDNWLLR